MRKCVGFLLRRDRVLLRLKDRLRVV